jgi:outer membrane protein assembly factor BamB
MDSINAPSVPPYLVILSYPTGFASQTFTAVDPTSGRSLGISFKADGVAATRNFLVQRNEKQNATGSGCTSTYAAWNTRSAATIWRRSFTEPVDTNGKCQGIQSQNTGDALALADSTGRTQVLDLATGKTEWAAAEPGPPVLMTNDVAVIANADGGVTTFDRRSGRTRWRTTVPSNPDALLVSLDARVLGRWLVVFDINADADCYSMCSAASVLDLESGSPYRAVPGRVITTTSGMVVTETETLGGPEGKSDYGAYTIQ